MNYSIISHNYLAVGRIREPFRKREEKDKNELILLFNEIIFEKVIYHWMLLDMNYFTISLDELSYLFRKFMETKY
jgi:hypothetical protein